MVPRRNAFFIVWTVFGDSELSNGVECPLVEVERLVGGFIHEEGEKLKKG